MKNRPFIQTAFLSLLGRTGGLIIPFLIAAYYGATIQTDAFFLAYGLAIAFTTLFSQMFESAIIPYLAALQGAHAHIRWFIRRALIQSLPFFAVAGMLLAFSLKPLLQAVGWGGEEAQMVRAMMLELQPFLWFGLGTAAWNALFYNRGLFWFPAVSPLVRALMVIGLILGAHQILGIRALTAGLAFGEALRFIWALWIGKRHEAGGPVEYPAGEADQALLKKFFADAFWQMAALLAVHLMVVADQCFAQTAGPGQLTLLSYADRLIQIPYLLFLSGFLNIFHADWSRASLESPSRLYAKLRRDLLGVAAGAAAASAALIATAPWSIGLFYGKAPLSSQEHAVLSGLFTWYALALAPGVLRLALGRVLIVLRASRFYFFQAWLELGLNIFLNAVFMRYFGVVGIAMATALAYTLSSIWLYAYLGSRERKGITL